MSTDARARIEAHRLLRQSPEPVVVVRDAAVNEQAAAARRQLMKRCIAHVVVFLFAFFLTAGIALVGVLLWVRPDELLHLVLVTLFCSTVFVLLFASARVFLLHEVLDLYPNKEEDPGRGYHWGKSIAYAFLALVVAFLMVALLVNIATAFT